MAIAGSAASWTEIAERCDIDRRGASFGKLLDFARQFNPEAHLAKATWNDVIAQRGPCLLHVNGDHYVVADPGYKDSMLTDPNSLERQIRAYNADGKPFYFMRGLADQIWSGATMFLQRSDLAEVGDGVHATTLWKDVGLQEPGKISTEVAIMNDSRGDATVQIARVSCGCIASELDRHLLRAGEHAALHCHIDLQKKEGGFREFVILRISQQGIETDLPINIVGEVADDWKLPSVPVFLGAAKPGSVLTKTVTVWAPTRRQGVLTEASIQPIEPFDIQMSARTLEDDAVMAGARLPVIGPPERLSKRIEVKALVPKGTVAGLFDAKVVLRVTEGESHRLLEVPVVGEIRSSVAAEPSVVVVDLASKTQQDERIAVRLSSVDEMVVDEVVLQGDSPFYVSPTEMTGPRDAMVYVCRTQRQFGDRGSAPTGTARLRVATDSGGLEIPIVWYTGVVGDVVDDE